MIFRKLNFVPQIKKESSMRKFMLSALLLASLAVLPLQAATWNIDAAHSSVQFAVTHLMVSTVRGYFNTFSGSVTSKDTAFADLTIEATIDAASIDTRQDKRDAHLRSADFFDTEKFPTITFTSKRTQELAPGKLTITGDLTMHGVTKEVVLDVTGMHNIIRDMQGNARAAATASVTLKRSDFGLGWNKAIETGGVVVSDDVQILIELELVRSQAS